MKTEKNYDFRARMCEVHRKDLYREGATEGREGLLIDGRYSILVPQNADELLWHAARDLADCFLVSYGVELAVTDRECDHAIRLVLSADFSCTAPSGKEERASLARNLGFLLHLLHNSESSRCKHSNKEGQVPV